MCGILVATVRELRSGASLLERIKEQVFKSNGIENIVKSMLNFPDHEDIQENACFCLQHFSQSGRVGVGD